MYSVGRMLAQLAENPESDPQHSQTGHSGYSLSTEDRGAKQGDQNFKSSLD